MSDELAVPGDGQFDVVRRGGYDPVQVDTYIARLHRQIDELRERQTPDGAVLDALNRVGDEVSSILKQAKVTADEIIAEAQRDADEQRERAAREGAEVTATAGREAAEITAEAERRVHELDMDTDRIWGERERIVADTRDLASRLQAVADLAAERFPSDAPAAPTGTSNGASAPRALGAGRHSA